MLVCCFCCGCRGLICFWFGSFLGSGFLFLMVSCVLVSCAVVFCGALMLWSEGSGVWWLVVVVLSLGLRLVCFVCGALVSPLPWILGVYGRVSFCGVWVIVVMCVLGRLLSANLMGSVEGGSVWLGLLVGCGLCCFLGSSCCFVFYVCLSYCFVLCKTVPCVSGCLFLFLCGSVECFVFASSLLVLWQYVVYYRGVYVWGVLFSCSLAFRVC